MSAPVRFGPGFNGLPSTASGTAVRATGFASRLSAGATAVPAAAGSASGSVSGRSVVGAATGDAPGALSYQRLLGGDSDPDGKMADLVDKCRQFIMTNMIFDAGNAPVVEKDTD